MHSCHRVSVVRFDASKNVGGGSRAIYRIVRLNKGFVESNDLEIVALERVAQDNAADAAEAIDTNFDDCSSYT